MMHRSAERVALLVALAGAAVCGLLLACLVIDVARGTATSAMVELIAKPREGQRDWNGILASNPRAAAWLTVEGTHIAEPVVAAPADNPAFYLSHDLYGNPDAAGCAFLDARCKVSSLNLLVYGHRMGESARMFSELGACWQQPPFDRLGEALWEQCNGTEERFQPLCALKVDSAWQPVQTFGISNVVQLRAWGSEICAEATARTADWEERLREAERILTLVTCSSAIPGQSDRTLVVFAKAAS